MGDTGIVADFCTCGAELPPDALFCHKCGKPQREIPLLEQPVLPAPAAAAPPPLTAAPPEIGLRNSQAVRVAFLAGSLGFLLSSLPFHPALRLLFLMAAGAFSVYLYRRRSGYSLEVRGGARIGWISGLFCFVIFMVMFTASVALLTVLLRDASMTAMLRDQLGSMGMSQEKVQEVMDVFQNPMQILGVLLWIFVTSTFITALGGALGARLFRKN
jgi:hypothetical protein